MKKIALITGASSGFGKAIAELFSENGINVILTGRRNELIKDLESNINNKGRSRALAFALDVRDRESCLRSIENLPPDWRNIDILINNAGLALGRDYFDEASIDDWDQMIDTNIKGVLYMSKAVIPRMIERNGGHIINIGSTAGNEVYEKGNVYCATKFSVNAISEAMRIDLLRHKIKVTLINPGAADTEFSTVRFKGDKNMADKVYEGYTPLYASDIANIALYVSTLPPHVCINELTVTCTAQANSFYLFKDQ